MHDLVSVFSFAIILKKKRELVCFAFIVLQMSCYCKCSVTLHHGALVGLKCVIVLFPDSTHLIFVAC